MHLGSSAELDTAKVVCFPSSQLTLIITKIAWYYLHERVRAAVAWGGAEGFQAWFRLEVGPPDWIQTGGPVSRN